jgi:ABC-type polysaccharide/polyol phosphate transport system ATPase subunit
VTAALTFDNVSKHFRGAAGYRAFRDDVAAMFARARGGHRSKAMIKALDEVSFEIPEGESVALIGENGAGKTTALKIATRIAYPTMGRMLVRGRVGALIEVGTGMHPELSGRENVQLYGRIMGLTGSEIAKRFDRIVEFSGIANAINQPVKQYSSGMQLRLGFSVAAHLEPDVFIVDEAIAVGDAAFQYKCIERMSELVREGRTLIFVSHDMFAVESLCHRALWLHNGSVQSDGRAPEVIGEYLDHVHRARAQAGASEGVVQGEWIDIERVSLLDAKGHELDEAIMDEAVTVRLHYNAKRPLVDPTFRIGLSEGGQRCFALATHTLDGAKIPPGEGWLDCEFTQLPLQPRSYELWGEILDADGYRYLIDWQRLRSMVVAGDVSDHGKTSVVHSMTQAPVRIPHEWKSSLRPARTNGAGTATSGRPQAGNQ